MIPMRALQPGLLSPVAIPSGIFKIFLDLKDFFFHSTAPCKLKDLPLATLLTVLAHPPQLSMEGFATGHGKQPNILSEICGSND